MKNSTPAVLVYFEDLLMGAEYMTDAEFGQYMRLLLRQNVVGHMSDDYLKRVRIDDIYPVVEEKFVRDEDGNLYNERMEKEILRRVNYSESRSKNRNGEKHMSEHMNEHMSEHMETETETYNRNNKKGIESAERKGEIETIVSYLNGKAGTRYRPSTAATKKHINARLNDGFSVDDFKRVIDTKCSEWMGTKYQKYLRPETLFGGKFESYLNQLPEKKSTGNAFLDLLQGDM